MFVVNHPGPWQHYINRPDNKGLSIMEIKSKYLKEQLLFEQYANQLLYEQYMSFQMQQQLLLSQNASGGGETPSDEGCLPLGGLMLTLDLSGDFGGGIVKLFLSEIGTENGKTLYLTSTGGNFGDNEYGVWYKVAWDSDTNLWKFNQIQSQNSEIQEILFATSPDLYNSEWTIVAEQFPPLSSSPGSEFNCDWRYCTIASGDLFSINPGYTPAWVDIPLTEPPNAYSPLGEGDVIVWSDDDSSWVVDRTILIGGTRDALPIGSFDISGDTLTINSGICAVEPLPVIPPSPYYTDFPDTVNQEVYIQTDGSGQTIFQDGVGYYTVGILNGNTTANFIVNITESISDNFFKDSVVDYDKENALVYIHDNIGNIDYNSLISNVFYFDIRIYQLELTLDTSINHNFSIFYFTGTGGDGDFVNIINVSGNMDNAAPPKKKK